MLELAWPLVCGLALGVGLVAQQRHYSQLNRSEIEREKEELIWAKLKELENRLSSLSINEGFGRKR